MKLAFALYRYFPYGGLQRDMLALAQEAQDRGHSVSIFCGAWDGPRPEGLDVRLVSAPAWFDVSGAKSFVRGFQRALREEKFDLVVGFNKMPGLDLYYAADSCFALKAYLERGALYRLTPRASLYLRFEKAVYSSHSRTRILELSSSERSDFIRYYGTDESRFYPIPPGLNLEHIVPSDPGASRARVRADLNIPLEHRVVLCLGSGFKTKGLDRSIQVFNQLYQHYDGKIHLMVVGQDKSQQFRKQGDELGISGNIHFLGGRDDVADLLQAADMLLHPAYRETAGNALLEAMLAGKPVVATSVCGYAHYIAQQQMGAVIERPYRMRDMVAAAIGVLDQNVEVWQQRAQEFAKQCDIYTRAPRAVDIMEQLHRDPPGDPEPPSLGDNVIALTLREELQDMWEQKNVFSLVQELPGKVVRDREGRQTLYFRANGATYYRKLHTGVGWREIFKNLVQLRLPVVGARNEWDAINKLNSLGMPTMTVLAFGEKYHDPARKLSFIVTRELTDTIPLDEYTKSWERNRPSFREKYTLLSEVAKISRKLHVNGINHRDFYLCHFLLHKESMQKWRKTGEPPLIYLVDLHRAQIRSQVPRRWLIKDLAGLYFSALGIGLTRRDVYRFLKLYFEEDLDTVFRDYAKILNGIERRAIRMYLRDHEVYPVLPVKA